MITIFFSIQAFSQEKSEGVDWGLRPHKANYILPFSYVEGSSDTNQNVEVSFQISLKFPVIGKRGMTSLYVAYTQKAFFQVYDTHRSRPFRNIDYNPQFFLRVPVGHTFFDIGHEHESNGTTDPRSRSWDKLYAKFGFYSKSFFGSIKGWWVFDEDQGDEIHEAMGKGKSILEYYGYGEIMFGYRLKKFQTILTGRFNTETSRGGAMIEMTYRVSKFASIYGHLFSGYGDSLIDYNHYVTRSACGVMLTL
jgi:phospholipase A1/A2